MPSPRLVSLTEVKADGRKTKLIFDPNTKRGEFGAAFTQDDGELTTVVVGAGYHTVTASPDLVDAMVVQALAPVPAVSPPVKTLAHTARKAFQAWLAKKPEEPMPVRCVLVLDALLAACGAPHAEEDTDGT